MAHGQGKRNYWIMQNYWINYVIYLIIELKLLSWCLQFIILIPVLL